MAAKFNSQICTTREQSQRLLDLGLKRETADMTWHFSYTLKGGEKMYECLAEPTFTKEVIDRYIEDVKKYSRFDHWKHSDGSQMNGEEVFAEITKDDIPAWSLHRLIEMIRDAIIRKDGNDDGYMLDVSGDGLYDGMIEGIEILIKEGFFNKEYLV